MKKQDKTAKKKRTILAVSAVGVLVLVGGAIAYNTNRAFFNNLFHLAYTNEENFIEVFDSPQNWACQEETPKSVKYRNGSGYTRAVRVKYEDYWKRNGSTSTDHETELPKEKNGKSLTKINLQNESDWILNQDGWYYYRYEVPDGATTTDFMESVTFDCDFEETEEYECETTTTGKECESGESDYMNANYHVYVTIQATTEPSTDNWPYTPTPSRQTLYDVIAAQTNGVDTNVDFNASSSIAVGNNNGVNTLSAHKDDSYPVYYYRGEVDNNVVFDNFCWRIVRTAEKGAVKMVYSGVYADGHCSDDNSSFNIGQARWTDDTSSYSPAYVGYMWGNNRYARVIRSFSNDGYGGTDVTWDGTKYTLVNPKKVGDLTQDEKKDSYRYYCDTNDAVNGFKTTCRDQVYYIFGAIDGSGATSTTGRTLKLTGGVNIEQAMANMTKNEVNSVTKSKVDEWFAANITTNLDKLADVVYCNDRHITYGALGEAGTYNHVNLYDGWVRMGGLANGGVSTPSVDCRNKNDSFTVSSKNGNGALTYPVAIMTADEYILGGIGFDGSYWGITRTNGDNAHTVYWHSTDIEKNYLYATGSYNSYYDTMTPLVQESSPMIIHNTNANMNARWADEGMGSVRPVIALKYRTYIKSGAGTTADPFILEWDE